MTDEAVNAQLQASVQCIFQTIFATNQMSRADLQTLILFIRDSQELSPEDLENIHLILELLESGQLKIVS